jgi:hypothetical protein
MRRVLLWAAVGAAGASGLALARPGAVARPVVEGPSSSAPADLALSPPALSPGPEDASDPRPDPRVLRFDDPGLIAQFVPEVAASGPLRRRALTIWREHYAARAREIHARFLRDEDWRPAFADASALLDEYLEATDLPRAGQWRGDGTKIWVETLDPQSGRRVRRLRGKPFKPLFAPAEAREGKELEKIEPLEKLRRDPRRPSTEQKTD